jgi:hypothetical protein
MPFTYHIDTAQNLLTVVAKGAMSQAERLDVIRTFLSDPAYRPGLNTLCDFSAASSMPTLAELREVMALLVRNAAAIGRIKVAVVAATPAIFGVARQFQALADATAMRVQVFGDKGAALAWLRGESG